MVDVCSLIDQVRRTNPALGVEESDNVELLVLLLLCCDLLLSLFAYLAYSTSVLGFSQRNSYRETDDARRSISSGFS